jgi:ribosomal protein L22
VSSALETQTVRAQAKWVRTSARKARVVAEHIRGRSVPEAGAVLAFSQRAVARDLEKVLSSAVANAESRPDLLWHGDELVVASVTVDEGPTLKRWRARARGRVARIKKRTCHITVLLAPAAPAAPAGREGRRRGAETAAAEPSEQPKQEKPKGAAAAKPTGTSNPSETTSTRAKRARKEA